jgi:hypothetical protein
VNRPSFIISRAAAGFFGRLEDQVDGAVEIAMNGQVPGGGQQHGRVAIVTTGVRFAGVDAGVSEAVVLRHRQRVDVCAKPHRTVATTALDDTDHPGLAQLLEGDFGVSMYIPAQPRHSGRLDPDGFHQLRTEVLRCMGGAHNSVSAAGVSKLNGIVILRA